MLGIFALFFLLFFAFFPHLCLHLVLHGKEKVKDWEGRKDVLLARSWHGLIILHQYAWPIGWRQVFTFWLLLGPINSCFLIFTEEFMGFKEGELGDVLSGAALSNETSFWCFFLFFHSVFLVNEQLDSVREMGKDSLGAKHERIEGSRRGLRENPRHWSVSNQLAYLGGRRTFSRSSSCSELSNLLGEGKCVTWWFKPDLFNVFNSSHFERSTLGGFFRI